MEENSTARDQEQEGRKSGWKAEWIVAIAAVLVSIATLFVYVYQASIMQQQQQTSVWPYLEWTFTISSEDGIFLAVENKGVGPAIIKGTTLEFDGKPVHSRDLVQAIYGRTDSLYIFYNTIDKRVMSPGQEIKLFHVKNPSNLRSDTDMMDFYKKLRYEICYCSIYGDCWTSKGMEVVESKCE